MLGRSWATLGLCGAYCSRRKAVAPSGRMKNSSGIESTPGVCGGAACVVRTRIPVWLLENARRLGTPEAELLRAYPQLRAEDLANAWAYVRSHRDEIDGEIRENEAA